jgi:aminoglycoside 2''-phosphotransferase
MKGSILEKEYQPYLRHIRNVFPFGIKHVDIHAGGDDFLVFEINSEWIFRFPRNEAAQVALEKEMKFLTRFVPRSPLPIPDYQYAGDGFAGYAKIRGNQLSYELFQALSRNTREKLAEQLGKFLSAINQFPLDEAAEIGLSRGWDGVHNKNGTRFLEEVTPLLPPSVRSKAMRCMEELLAEEFEGKVIHGDFYFPDHIFLNESQSQLGVIDFADVNVYDPAHDFQCVIEIGGDIFLKQ